MNQLTEANRVNAIRARVREAADNGRLCVVAAKARVSEGMLYEWLEDISHMPSHAELVSIQDAVGEQITLPNSLDESQDLPCYVCGKRWMTDHTVSEREACDKAL